MHAPLVNLVKLSGQKLSRGSIIIVFYFLSQESGGGKSSLCIITIILRLHPCCASKTDTEGVSPSSRHHMLEPSRSSKK